jgi:hypothetical protein
MRTTLTGVIAAVFTAAALTIVFHATAPVAGQTAAYRAPRTPDGKPDFNGIWQAMNEANYDIQAHMARPAMALRAGPYGPVPAAPVLALGAVGSVPPGMGVVEGDEIPYKPEALAKKKDNQEKWLDRDPEIKCYLPGIPRATYMPYPFQIFQSPSALFFAYEYAGAVRNVYLKDPGPAPIDSWMGQSVGRYEGESLIIESSGFNDTTWFDRAGNHHSDKLKTTERFTRTSPDVINYEVTIEDPVTFTKSWKMSMPLYRRAEKNAQLLDFKCVEFVEELLYGKYRKKPLTGE